MSNEWSDFELLAVLAVTKHILIVPSAVCSLNFVINSDFVINNVTNNVPMY